MKKLNKTAILITSIFLLSGLTASAESQTGRGFMNKEKGENFKGRQIGFIRGPEMSNRVAGIISTINGNTITLSGNGFGKNEGKITFTIDATNAKIEKNKAEVSISSLVIGDNVFVEGKVSDKNVSATKITVIDHKPMQIGKNENFKRPEIERPVMPEGNGQPIVGGTVSAINGNTITINNKSNIAYTVDATNAKITKDGKTASISNILVGDSVMVQGTINGTSVVASTITSQTVKNIPVQASGENKTVPVRGFFGAIGGFFSKLFGF